MSNRYQRVKVRAGGAVELTARSEMAANWPLENHLDVGQLGDMGSAMEIRKDGNGMMIDKEQKRNSKSYRSRVTPQHNHKSHAA
ncbi:hypothetical protein [Deinococcus rubellus]|uniref:hypothetical protein n=1 Tax=Deinococcus rubellus TaxID=1889240 RepID=UPI0031E6F1A3